MIPTFSRHGRRPVRRATALFATIALLGCGSSSSHERAKRLVVASPDEPPPPRPSAQTQPDPEPWKPLPAAPLALSLPAHWQIPPRSTRDDPPRPPRASVVTRHRRALAEIEALWRAGRKPAARRVASERIFTRRLAPHAPTALAISPCVPCATDAVTLLAERAAKRQWRWRDARLLRPLLTHADERVRAAALDAWSKAAIHLALPKLRRRLAFFVGQARYLASDPSPLVRAAAVRLLGAIHHRSAFRLLAASADDPAALVRLAATRAIRKAVARTKWIATSRALCRLVDDPSPPVRAAAINALRGAPQACPLPAIFARLLDFATADLTVRTAQSGRLGHQQALHRTVGEAAYWALPADLRATADPQGSPQANQAAAWRLGRKLRADLRALSPRASIRPRPPARPADANAVDPSPAELRRLAKRPLSLAAIARVAGALAASPSESRAQAIATLAASAPSAAREPLLPYLLWLSREDAHPLCRRSALRLLTRWHEGPATRRRVAYALADPDPAVRLTALRRAIRLAPGRLAQRLPELLADPSPIVRAEAVYVGVGHPRVLRIAPKTVAKFLQDTAPTDLARRLGGRPHPVHSRFPTVRDAAIAALEKRFGLRHRGEATARALRWQDDLMQRGWRIPTAAVTAKGPDEPAEP